MRERPILFSTPMVRAILAGAKTQTRRVVKPQPDIVAEGGTVVGVSTAQDQRYGRLGKALRCPYGQPGDRLWVREAWAPQVDCELSAQRWTSLGVQHGPQPIVHFRADSSARTLVSKWRPSIHMPRWASRITLEVTGVRVERLQDISTGDCWAEGIESSPEVNPLHEYCDLWESINGPGSWDANPWVWVVEFRRANEKTHRSAALGADHDGRVGAVGHSGSAA